MNLQQNISLSTLTTMRLGGKAAYVTEIHTPAEAQTAVHYAREHDLPWYVIGGGSNTLAHDAGYDELIILNKITGFNTLRQDSDTLTLKVGGGEIWDEVVRRSVEMNLSGIECLSSIPGTAGATPVQNIGAYGQEVGDVISIVEAYDSQTDSFVALANADCQFGYRHSMFRGSEAGRYIITAIELTLSKHVAQPPFYAAVQAYLDDNNIHEYSPHVLRSVVMNIRADKLPDPSVRPNTGSFFKNAIISATKLTELQQAYPNIPHYDMGNDMYKVPSGWLIDQAGLRGALRYGIRIHDKNALVLINEAATSFDDLARARQDIIDTVHAKFDITIEQEPLEIAS